LTQEVAPPMVAEIVTFPETAAPFAGDVIFTGPGVALDVAVGVGVVAVLVAVGVGVVPTVAVGVGVLAVAVAVGVLVGPPLLTVTVTASVPITPLPALFAVAEMV
jgi:hypothetical protein